MTGETILCGVDFSDDARAALGAAAVLAGRLKLRLCVATVSDSLVAQIADAAHLSDRLKRDTADRLQKFTASIVPPGAAWAPSLTHREEIGHAADCLIRLAAEEHAALIVVGGRGLSRSKSSWLGATTTRLLRTSSLPVMVVPLDSSEATGQPTSEPALGFDRIVCGVDFSEASNAACREAAWLAGHFSLPILLVHAVIAPDVPSMLTGLATSMVADRLNQQRKLLEGRAAALGPLQIDVNAEAGEPAATIARHAAGSKHPLIALGLGSDDPAARPGTIATRVLQDARVPVLAVPVPRRTAAKSGGRT